MEIAHGLYRCIVRQRQHIEIGAALHWLRIVPLSRLVVTDMFTRW
jgi:hypothetical protein